MSSNYNLKGIKSTFKIPTHTLVQSWLPCLLCFYSLGDKGPEESVGISGRQHEEVCQRHAGPVWRHAEAQTAVCQSGGSYAEAQPVLHLPQRGKGHVSQQHSIRASQQWCHRTKINSACWRPVLTEYFSPLHRDEDMQSLASLLSMKQSDIGNLDDFIDSDDEGGEERRASFGSGLATPVTGE